MNNNSIENLSIFKYVCKIKKRKMIRKFIFNKKFYKKIIITHLISNQVLKILNLNNFNRKNLT